MQPRHQVARQEGAVSRSAENELYVRLVGRSPVERRENACERAGKIRDAVGDDWKPERGKARGIAIGVEDEAVALRLHPHDHAIEEGAVGNGAHRLFSRPPSLRPGAAGRDSGGPEPAPPARAPLLPPAPAPRVSL